MVLNAKQKSAFMVKYITGKRYLDTKARLRYEHVLAEVQSSVAASVPTEEFADEFDRVKVIVENKNTRASSIFNYLEDITAVIQASLCVAAVPA